uniref:Uncharacterized protein n=1 Tax=Glossina austeni TaxID=7395 RepID=A0A1A9UDE4_GLOAU
MSGNEKATSDLMVDKQQSVPQRMSSPSVNRASNVSKHPTGSDTKKDKKHNIPHQHSQKYSQENKNGNIFSQNLKKASERDLTTTNYHFGDIVEREEKCVSRLIKLIFSTPGLVAMVIIYSIMGATIFPLIETSENVSKTALIAKSREECLKELWTITGEDTKLY